MLLATNKKFLVMTPTKTGTFSLESCLRTAGTWEQRMPRHGREVPAGWRGAHAIVITRNPYARLVSMFTYGQVKGHSWLVRHGRNGFEEFVMNWLAARAKGRPHDWVTLVSEYVTSARAQCNRVSHYPLERGGVAKVLRLVQCEVKERHVNKSHDKFHAPWQTMWTPELVRECRLVLAPDMRLGKYGEPI